MRSRAVQIIVAVAVAIALFLSVNAGMTLIFSYNPKNAEEISLVGERKTEKISPDEVKILTFNTGYGALGSESDLKKEGGRGKRASADVVLKNIRGISELVNLSSADVMLLQSVDIDSHRSRYVDQFSYYINNGSYVGSYATDYKLRSTSLLPPYKKVTSGLTTLSRKAVLSAERVSLPQNGGALSHDRCMLVSEFEVEKTDKKLVVINFELDAYISEDIKTQQFKAVTDYAQKRAENGDYVIIGGSFYKAIEEAAARYELSSKNKWNPEEFSVYDIVPKGWVFAFDSTVPSARILSAPYNSVAEPEEKQVYCADGYILSPNIDVVMVATVDQEFRYSAHNPVMLSVKLK